MILFRSFVFQKDMFYQAKTNLPLSTVGLSFLRGKNYDAGSADLSNGTGKTRLFQIMESFIYDLLADRGRFKRMVLPEFSGTLEFEDTRTKILWSFSFDAKENKWSILRNGAEHHVSHKPSDCRAFLQKTIGLTHDEWNYFVSIDQNSIRVLLKGKPAERRAYLESFFNIDSFYSEKKDEYDKATAQLGDQIVLLNQERARLDQIKLAVEKLPPEEWLKQQVDLLHATLPLLKTNRATVSSDAEELRSQLTDWQEYQELHEQLSSTSSITPVATLKRTVEKLFSERAAITETLETKSKLEKIVRLELTPLERKKPAEPRPEPESDEPSGKEILEKSTAVSQMQSKLKLKKRLTELAEALEDAELPENTKDFYATSLTQATTDLADAQFHLNLLAKGEDGACPTCGQMLPMLADCSAEEVLAALKQKAAAATASMAACKKAIEQFRQHEQVSTRVTEVQAEFEACPVFGVKLSEAQNELNTLTEVADAWRTWRDDSKGFVEWKTKHTDVMARVNALGYPDLLEADFSDDLDRLNDAITSVQEELKQVSRYEELTEILTNYPSASKLKNLQEEAQAEIIEWDERIEKLNILRGEFSSQLSVINQHGTDLEVLERKLVDYDTVQREHRISTALTKFFSPAGFKIYELKKRCGLFIERANYWSSAFFQEPYEWSLPTEIDDLDFLVQPKNHRTVAPYPAGELSGGEGNRASRVLLFSQLQLVPPNKRTNLLVIDEIEDKLDQAGVIAFTDEVVPKLKSTFPDKTIILISHQKGLKTSEAVDHLWLVERKDRKTTLKTFPFYNRRQQEAAADEQS